MKLIKFLFGLLLSLLVLVSCTKFPDQEEISFSKDEMLNPSIYKISKEEAVKNLIETLKCINSKGGLRNTSKYKNWISQLETKKSLLIQSIKTSSLRSNPDVSQKDENEELVYIVNFDEKDGYAILSADTRIPETVLAIVEDGYCSKKEFSSEGIFLTEEDRQKEIENFHYYDEEMQNIYVGIQDDNKDKNFPKYCLIEYAENSIDNHEKEDGNSQTYSRKTEWEIKEQQSALLDTKWHQGTPFNDLCPERRKYLLFGDKRTAPAGCVPLAVAQILAFHEYPNFFSYGGISVEWKKVKKIWAYNSGNDPYTDAESNKMAAALLRGIGDWVNIKYGYSGSMGLPILAKKFFSSNGYSNVKYHSGKNEDKTLDMLRKGNPVLISGSTRSFGGHSWIIDGYKMSTRDIQTIESSTGNVISTKTEKSLLLHCNWGWGGVSDGYYVSGIFDTRSQPIELDNKDEKRDELGDSKFKWFFSIITYDNPSEQ